MIHSRWRIVLVIAGAIVILIAAVLVSNFLRPVVPEASSPVEEEQINTQEWRTYSNVDAGFEFQYPADWEIRERAPYRPTRFIMDEQYLALDPLLHFLSPRDIAIQNSPTYTDQRLGFIVVTYNVNSDVSLSEWVQGRFDRNAPWSGDPILMEEQTKLNGGYEAYKVHQAGLGAGTLMLIFKGDQHIISISADPSLFEENTFKAILNTIVVK